MWDIIWVAAGLALIFEAVLPFTNPKKTKEMWRQMAELPDGELRKYAGFTIVFGLIIVMLVTN